MINKQRFFPGFHIKHLKFSQFDKRSHDLKEEPDWIIFLKSEGRGLVQSFFYIDFRDRTN